MRATSFWTISASLFLLWSKPARMKLRSGMVTEGSSRNRNLRLFGFSLSLRPFFGYDAEQVAVPGPDKEEVLKVPGAFVVAVLGG